MDHAFIEIPEGFSYFGSTELDPYASEKEKPLHHVFLSSFFISKYPTTVEQFAYFLRDEEIHLPFSCQNIHISSSGHVIVLPGTESLPITGISWELANCYCAWLSRRLGKRVTLPSEAEWEKAARGEDARIWPWGNVFDSSRCNSAESGLNHLCDVHSFESGASPYGVLHMAGNVWEWCIDYWHQESHTNVALVNPISLSPSDRKVVKGGSAFCTKEIVRITCRDWTNSINQGGGDDGFRVVYHPD